jgi:hypothetical protein
MSKQRILKMLTESHQNLEVLNEAYDPTKPRTLKFKGVFLVSE